MSGMPFASQVAPASADHTVATGVPVPATGTWLVFKSSGAYQRTSQLHEKATVKLAGAVAERVRVVGKVTDSQDTAASSSCIGRVTTPNGCAAFSGDAAPKKGCKKQDRQRLCRGYVGHNALCRGYAGHLANETYLPNRHGHCHPTRYSVAAHHTIAARLHHESEKNAYTPVGTGTTGFVVFKKSPRHATKLAAGDVNEGSICAQDRRGFSRVVDDGANRIACRAGALCW